MAKSKHGKRRKSRPRKRRRVLGLLVFLLIGVLVAAFYYRTTIFFAGAEKAISQRDFDQASADLAWVRFLSPNHARLYFLEARIARLQGRMTDMMGLLDQAMAAGLEAKAAEHERWLALAQQGQLQDAMLRFRELILASRGDEREICEAFVVGFMRAREHAAAKDVLRNWRKDFPQDPRPIYMLGLMQAEERFLVEAEKSFREVLAIDAEHHDAAFELGSVLLSSKRPSAALPYLQQGSQSEKHALAGKVAQAACHRLLGDHQQAASLLNEVLGETKRHPAASLEMARLELDQRKFQEVVDRLQSFVDEDPRRTEMRMVLAQAYRGLGQDAEADRHLLAVAEKSKKLLEANALAENLMFTPESADARHRIGIIYLQYGSDSEGLDWLRGAYNVNPQHLPTLRALITYYESKNDEQRAADYRGQLARLRE